MHTNSLINETSPYLLQHAHNPVNWFAWNDETLLKAQSENKMLLISIGYAACHWCHVMEHESFENEEVARVMNIHFICIKVDREERPDVDQVYMDAAYLVNGTGGWPLNALAMPDGKPFFAGTYYPKENWIRLLEYFAGIYQNERSKLEEQAAHLSKGIAEIENFPAMVAEENFHKESFEKMFLLFEKRIDKQKGGTLGAMKFPMPSVWEYLLQYHHFSGSKESLQAVETTLINMAKGGIYDQVGGGFSRYATDPQWHVPHFEKMLYDNGQLVSLYSHAFQVNKNPVFKRIVYETITFVNRELLSPGGGYYSSLDADSEGEEGKFYVWSKDEIKEILKEDAELFIDYYGITSSGNWETGKNIPDMNFGSTGLEEKYGESAEAILQKCIKANDLLLKAREKRVRPATDDKILTSWNAIMARGFIDAYRGFGEIHFLQDAKKTLDFLLKNIVNTNHSIYRNFKNDKATIPAFLDDYAFLIAALIEYYQVSFDESYLLKAQNIMTYTLENFYDTSTGTFYYTDKQFSKLIARKKEITDNVIPSSNSEMAANLLKLGIFFDNADYQEKSARMVKNIFEETVKNVGYYSNWAITALQHIRHPFEIALVGNDWKSKVAELQKNYLPHAVFMGGNREGKLPLLKNKMVEGKTMIYVCKNKNCQLPVEQAGSALEQLSS